MQFGTPLTYLDSNIISHALIIYRKNGKTFDNKRRGGDYKSDKIYNA